MANAADCEFWRVSPPRLKTLGAQAKRLEEQGWTGMTVGDSQNIAPDTYTVMALAVAATSTIKLCTWVTNPLTRHPATAAGALATLQAESGGRIEAGIGRGDSALAFLGLAPAPVGYFENYVRRLRGYLRAEDVPMQTELDGKGLVAGAKSLDLADRPMTSKLTWLPEDYRPVPVIVSASGPKVMALGARIADGVTAVVGPDPRRLAWARDEILGALKAAGRPAGELTLGASCVVAVSEDLETARAIARPMTAVQARFAIMHNRVNGPSTAAVRSGLQILHDTYNMNLHARRGAEQNKTMPNELVDSFSIAGPVSYCTERLLEIIALGFTRLTLSVESPDADPDAVALSQRLLADQVLPAVRRG